MTVTLHPPVTFDVIALAVALALLGGLLAERSPTGGSPGSARLPLWT